MDANLILGSITAGIAMTYGVVGIVLYRRNGKNGHPTPPAEIAPREITVRGLDALPGMIEQGLAPVFGGFLSCLSDQVDRLDHLAQGNQSVQMVEGLERIREQLSQPAPPPPTWPPEMVPLCERLAERLDAMQQPAPSAAIAELALSELDKVAAPLAQLPGQLDSIFERLSKQVSELLAAERSRPPRPAPPPETKSTAGGTGGDITPPARQAPPNLPRLNPGALPATPSIPAPYVPGSVYVPAGEVWSLLYLIQQQLSANCPGSSVEFALSSDDEILVGGASSIGGPLSETNYAYRLTPDTSPRIYRSTYPGGNTPVGELQVLAPSGGYLHVEVQA